MSSYWLVVRSDNKTIVIDKPEESYIVGRSSSLPVAQQLHHKYISREHLRFRYAPPALLVFQCGKNPSFYGPSCEPIPGNDVHETGNDIPKRTHNDRTIESEVWVNDFVHDDESSSQHNHNNKNSDNDKERYENYSKALVFCAPANGMPEVKNSNNQIHNNSTDAAIVEPIKNGTKENRSCNKFYKNNSDNVVYVDVCDRDSARNAPERELIGNSTIYFPDELHLPTLTIRYVCGVSETSNTSPSCEGSNQNIHALPDLGHKESDMNKMLAVPILKEIEEEEELEEEEKEEEKKCYHTEHHQHSGDVQSTTLFSPLSSGLPPSEVIPNNSINLQMHHSNDTNEQIAPVDRQVTQSQEIKSSSDKGKTVTKTNAGSRKWEGLLNEAMKEAQRRLTEVEEQEEQNQQQHHNTEDKSHYEMYQENESRQKGVEENVQRPTTSSASRKRSDNSNSNNNNNTNSENVKQNTMTIPFGATLTTQESKSKEQTILQKSKQQQQVTNTRKRPRTRRSRSSLSSSSSSSSSESESSFTSSTTYDDESSAETSSRSSTSSDD